jgi:5-(carboxyamino)imidazole ribonucleotide mutase
MEMNPTVGIIMGSKSDLETMEQAAKVLEEFGVSYEIKVVSAHRTPDAMVEYAKSARGRGLKVIVAGAGGAAHLPGMVASLTTLPVIGVPIQTKALGGVDSLYSIVQMPAGIPVATVAIGNARNAGLLALRILGASDMDVAVKLDKLAEQLRQVVDEMNQTVERTWAGGL